MITGIKDWAKKRTRRELEKAFDDKLPIVPDEQEDLLGFPQNFDGLQ
jgi:hypothetical protein